MKQVLYKTFFLLLFFCFSFHLTYAQNEVKQIQPTIMVIPAVKENEDLRTMLDSSITTRVAIAKTKEAFDDRGFTTVDFVAKLKATKVDATFTSLNQKDLKSRLIEASGADIYVEVEALEQKSGSGNSVRLIFNAYDAFTGRGMGTKTISSNTVYTDKFDKLVENALKKTEKEAGTNNKIILLEDFLNVMQTKFDDMIENGRAIKIIFGLEEGIDFNFDTEITDDGDLLKDLVMDWADDTAYKNNYNDQGMSDVEIIFSEFRIPLRTEKGRNLRPSRFARTIRKYFRKILNVNTEENLNVSEDVRGGTIYVTFK